MSRKHLVAWGAEGEPDIDITGNEIQFEIDHALKHHAFVMVTCLDTVDINRLIANLEEETELWKSSCSSEQCSSSS